MKRVYTFKEKRKLEVGETYEFWVLKTIQLPDGEKYYVMRGPFGEKHLVPTKYYENYNIINNKYYKCHVDKINCLGRIFIEPLHPEYTIGNYYEFRFERTEKYITRKGNNVAMFLMKGHNNDFAYLPMEETTSVSDIKAWKMYQVVKIKKAMVFLT